MGEREGGGGRGRGEGKRESMIIIGTEDNLHKSVLSFYLVGSRNGAEIQAWQPASSSTPEPSPHLEPRNHTHSLPTAPNCRHLPFCTLTFQDGHMRDVRDPTSNLGDWLFMLRTITHRLIQALVHMVRAADSPVGEGPFHLSLSSAFYTDADKQRL